MKIRQEKGITLVALIITIIILLILVTVSISLVINNGILDKAKSAVDKYSESEITEQIKLAYLECQTEKLYNSNVNEEYFIRESLREKFNDNSLTVKLHNGKMTVNMAVKGENKIYKYDSSTGEIFLDIINYGDKTEDTVILGDDISIGTEKFRVFYNQDGVIKAMPWYNIELKLDNPKQSSSQLEIAFSSDNYWAKEAGWNDSSRIKDGSVNIDMTAKNDDGTYKNNIQQYIDAYKETLKDMGQRGITVRACTKPELDSELGAELQTPLTDTEKKNIRNPGKGLYFWLGSAPTNYNSGVCYVKENGDFHDYYGRYSRNVSGQLLRCSSNYNYTKIIKYKSTFGYFFAFLLFYFLFA